MITVQYLSADDFEVTLLLTKDGEAYEEHICLDERTPEAAAAEWAKAAYGVEVLPPPEPVADLAAKQLAIITADPSLAQSTKDAIVALVDAITEAR